MTCAAVPILALALTVIPSTDGPMCRRPAPMPAAVMQALQGERVAAADVPFVQAIKALRIERPVPRRPKHLKRRTRR